MSWPCGPRKASRDKIPVAASAHGTGELSAKDRPSHLRGLSYQFAAPFTLALAAQSWDYTGLGVSKDTHGSPVTQEFLSSPSPANHLFDSLQAARAAFRQLSYRTTSLFWVFHKVASQLGAQLNDKLLSLSVGTAAPSLQLP